MILIEKVRVKIRKNNIDYYSKILEEDLELKEIIYINPIYLTKGSHIKVKVKCDICSNEQSIEYKAYLHNINKDDRNSYHCFRCKTHQLEKTLLKKYNVTNIAKLESTTRKKEVTCLKKYGKKSFFQTEDFIENMKKIKIEQGYNIIGENATEWELYHSKCISISIKKYKTLKENWDGFDYYDNEYIKTNYDLNPNHKNYPTVDHKTSISYGFLHKFSIEEISSIENLCITKRCINSSKHSLTEEQFKSRK